MPSLKPNLKRLLIAAVLLAAVAAACVYFFTGGTETTDDAVIDGHVAPISAKVSGYVAELNVSDNQQVKAGDVLAVLDAVDYRIRQQQAQADLSAAKARYDAAASTLESTRISAPSGLESARSQVREAEANLERAAADVKRFRAISPEARTQKQLDDAVSAQKAAQAVLDDAKARLRTAGTAPQTVKAAEAGVEQLAAAVKRAEADAAEAEQNLTYTQIVAPVDGRVTQRSAEKGALVQPGQQLMTIVGADYWVVANFKETQLADMKPGQAVDIRIDAYPQHHYRGKVDSIQGGTGAFFSAFPPQNATGNFVKIVQRVPVKIVFDERPDAALPVGPGMSVAPKVYTR